MGGWQVRLGAGMHVFIDRHWEAMAIVILACKEKQELTL